MLLELHAAHHVLLVTLDVDERVGHLSDASLTHNVGPRLDTHLHGEPYGAEGGGTGTAAVDQAAGLADVGFRATDHRGHDASHIGHATIGEPDVAVSSKALLRIHKIVLRHLPARDMKARIPAPRLSQHAFNIGAVVRAHHKVEEFVRCLLLERQAKKGIIEWRVAFVAVRPLVRAVPLHKVSVVKRIRVVQ